MYNFFLQDYIEEIYRSSLRRLKWIEKILFAALFIVSIIFSVFSFLNIGVKLRLICFTILVVLLTIIYFYYKCYLIHKKDERFKRYNDRLTGLKELLNEQKYDLYNKAGIEWLIECSRIKINGGSINKLLSSFKNFFQLIVFPITTLTFGVVISDISYTDAITYAVSVIMVIGFLAIIFMSVQYVYEMVFEHEKEICEYMLNDLTYLHTKVFQN